MDDEFYYTNIGADLEWVDKATQNAWALRGRSSLHTDERRPNGVNTFQGREQTSWERTGTKSMLRGECSGSGMKWAGSGRRYG